MKIMSPMRRQKSQGLRRPSDDEDLSDDDDDITNETLAERLYALVDVIPYSKRRAAYVAIENTISTTFSLARTAGKGIWIIATGALLIALPVALEIEREHFAMSQESAQRMQQIQAQGQHRVLFQPNKSSFLS
ncbi:mitochondrial import receptor subunit Tom22-domain-containing protein [Chytridium lagenaria]|nr:mitochondrial import receptor subunit Tom22-domain-containing protein [Chytridium lagenaria]